MATASRLTLALALFSATSLTVAQEPRPLPPVPFTLGMMMSYVDTADAYRVECAPHLSAAELHSAVGAWFARNQPLIDKILEAGRRTKWYDPNRSPEEVWSKMRNTETARIRAQVAQTVKPSPKLMCMDGTRLFRDGSIELKYFPYHLKALGISVP
jgi:hypothetical protein